MIDLAGGVDVLGSTGQPSHPTSWDVVRALEPELVIVGPCGFDVNQAASVPPRSSSRCPAVAVDGDAYYSRPAPRLADGVPSWHTSSPERRTGSLAPRDSPRPANGCRSALRRCPPSQQKSRPCRQAHHLTMAMGGWPSPYSREGGGRVTPRVRARARDREWWAFGTGEPRDQAPSFARSRRGGCRRNVDDANRYGEHDQAAGRKILTVREPGQRLLSVCSISTVRTSRSAPSVSGSTTTSLSPRPMK